LARGLFAAVLARAAFARVEGEAVFLAPAFELPTAFAGDAFSFASAVTAAGSGALPEPLPRLLLRCPGRERGRLPSTVESSLLSAATDEK
jgi:hypothetical protein